MLCDYRDITKRIDERPGWFDEHGVPRYCNKHPHNIADIYAYEALFYEIACPKCDEHYIVCSSTNYVTLLHSGLAIDTEEEFQANRFILKNILDSGKLPEYIGTPCWKCYGGFTMCSVSIRPISYWRSNLQRGWSEVSL